MELEQKLGLYRFYETDDHKELPMYLDTDRGGLVNGGDKLSAGITVAVLSKSEYNLRNEKPNAREFVNKIKNRSFDAFYGLVFAIKRPEAITVYSDRLRIPDKTKGIAKAYDDLATKRYFGMLVQDLFRYLSDSDIDKIRSMPA